MVLGTVPTPNPTVPPVRNDPVNTACRTLMEDSRGCEADQAALQGAKTEATEPMLSPVSAKWRYRTKIRPIVWVAERLVRDTPGKEDRPLWSSRSA
jgi:hypothetical protein